mmetsp:Transcript_8191/g.21428  ORF Transcript_8191/g.21428 Transcript_8191/m.21428 type:complete len:144 (+) Transcript_8191:76-507(+)
MPLLKLKHGSTSLEIELQPGEQPYARIAAAFNLNPSRIKLIRAGKLLPPAGTPDLTDAIHQPGTLLVLSSNPLPGTATRMIASARRSLQLFWHSLTLEAVQFYLTFALTWVWSCFATGSRTAIAFVTSAVVAPAPSRRENRQE